MLVKYSIQCALSILTILSMAEPVINILRQMICVDWLFHRHVILLTQYNKVNIGAERILVYRFFVFDISVMILMLCAMAGRWRFLWRGICWQIFIANTCDLVLNAVFVKTWRFCLLAFISFVVFAFWSSSVKMIVAL